MRRAKSDIVVMKFGGTVRRRRRADQARRAADRRRARERQARRRGALGARQDHRRAVAQAMEISERPDPREMDMLLSTGERISCALCAMAIHDMGP
jgi:aspartate kinase